MCIPEGPDHHECQWGFTNGVDQRVFPEILHAPLAAVRSYCVLNIQSSIMHSEHYSRHVAVIGTQGNVSNISADRKESRLCCYEILERPKH